MQFPLKRLFTAWKRQVISNLGCLVSIFILLLEISEEASSKCERKFLLSAAEVIALLCIVTSIAILVVLIPVIVVFQDFSPKTDNWGLAGVLALVIGALLFVINTGVLVWLACKIPVANAMSSIPTEY